MATREIKWADHEEWLEIRSKYIGGSDAGAVVGMNPYKSAYTLWAEKTGRIEGFKGNLTTEVGAYLEEFVAKLFERDCNKKVRRKNSTIVNDAFPFACANVDRMIVGEKALLEIKTTNSIPIMKAIRNSSEFPEAYYCQVMHYLAVTGLDKAYLAVLVNCRDVYYYTLERDEAEIKSLMDAEREFWSHVENDTAPSTDGSESTSDTLGQLYPNADGTSVSLIGHGSFVSEYVALKAQIKELTKLADERANIIKEFMGSASKGELPGFKVSYGEQSRKSFDTKRFAADHGNMDLSSYYKTSTTRVFKVTETK